MAPMTRRSLAAAMGDGEAAPPTATAEPAEQVPRRGPGRPRKADPASRASSTAPTTTATSETGGSDYGTPLTSYAPTPAESAKAAPARSVGRIEVRLPAAPPPTALHRSIYSMKRKRITLNDSDDDDDDSDFGPDAKLARKLQDEEYAKGPRPAAPPLGRGSRNMTYRLSRDEDVADHSPKIAARHASKPNQSIARTYAKDPATTIPDSEDLSDSPLSELEEELVSDSSLNSLDLMPHSRRRRTRGMDQGYIVTDDDDEEEYDPTLAPRQAARLPDEDDDISGIDDDDQNDDEDEDIDPLTVRGAAANRRAFRRPQYKNRAARDRARLEENHPELKTLWTDLAARPVLKAGKSEQPNTIKRQLKGFQLEGLAWMKAMEETEWKGGLLGDEMGLGKTIQAVSLIMSDFPAKKPTLVLVPPVALMQWTTEIESYTDGTLKTLVLHGTNSKSKNLTVKDIKQYHVIIMSYNSLESMYRKQEKGFKRKEGIFKEESVIHQTTFHRAILDEAHSIKTRTTMTAKACFALKVEYRWCLSGTPLQNRIGEFFSLVRFLNIKPFACYLCKDCPCSNVEWGMDGENRCGQCGHNGMRHVSVFNQELLNPIQKFGNRGPGREAFKNLRTMTDRIMLRRLKKDHTNAMELPVKEINVERQFFGEEENDFANSIMTNGQRKFDTYVATGVMLNNYANIFGLIMQMRQVANHPDLILKKNSEGGQNVLVCNICDEPAEDAIRSRCKHDFCRVCAKTYLNTSVNPECPQCHIPLAIDLEQPEMEQDEVNVKKSSIINRIKMENWTSSSKIELLVHELHKLRSDHASHKSIIFSQFTTMLQLIEWRLRRAGITTVMLDGSMSPAQRQASINHFMTNVDVECFLVSLKAGGVALNLTEASRVFIVDPWWNPAAEWQSADRCHRIGQSRPCTITRLCIEDSVESRMVLLQEKKTNMINSTINSDDAAMESLSPEDLQFLFRGS
ncbi:SNF2 family N-terminal domain-containing protein [Podospora conica]|nr:SNF2 family N-terminal domain-containing protein [Schizothecium conicum]